MLEIREAKNRPNIAPLEDQSARVDSTTFSFSCLVPLQAASQSDNRRADDWQHGTQHNLPFVGLYRGAPLTFDNSKLTTKNISLLHT